MFKVLRTTSRAMDGANFIPKGLMGRGTNKRLHLISYNSTIVGRVEYLM